MARILVVDDEEIVLKSLAALLTSEGYEAVARKSVMEALEVMADTEFDLLITDIRMAPVDGMELIRIVHERTPGLPIIVISAYSSETIKEEGMRRGCVAYFAKPFRAQDVLDAVQSALESSRG